MCSWLDIKQILGIFVVKTKLYIYYIIGCEVLTLVITLMLVSCLSPRTQKTNMCPFQ